MAPDHVLARNRRGKRVVQGDVFSWPQGLLQEVLYVSLQLPFWPQNSCAEVRQEVLSELIGNCFGVILAPSINRNLGTNGRVF